jgi:hypothetical protein
MRIILNILMNFNDRGRRRWLHLFRLVTKAMSDRLLGQRCATKCRRGAERLEEKNRTDHELHTPDKLTCYLQSWVNQRCRGLSAPQNP